MRLKRPLHSRSGATRRRKVTSLRKHAPPEADSSRLLVHLAEGDLVELIRAAVREELAAAAVGEPRKPLRAHLTSKEAAQELGCSERYIRKLIAQGRLRAAKLVPGPGSSRVRILRTSIRAALARGAAVTWLEEARELGAADVASRLSYEVRRTPSATHWPCCACEATTRYPSRGDRRGAVGSSNAQPCGWYCFECTAGGDAVDLVAYALRGARFRDLTVEARAEVRAWFECELGSVDMGARAPRPPRAAPPVAPPRYPPQSQVRALWEASSRVDVHEAVRDYLHARGIDAGRVADLDLARDCAAVLRPSWGQRFVDPYRVLVPLFDAHGAMRSVLARSIDPSSDPKSLAPSGGHQRTRLVMACPFAREILATGERPTWWASDELRIVVAEGEADFLAAATQWSDAAEYAPATLGIVSGSWSAEVAVRIPDGTVIVIATDDDAAGNKYSDQIVASFAGRDVALERWLASDAEKRAV